jgi:thiamine-monophosphate kinase
MDITDGLIQDAGKLSQISKTIIQIDLDLLPRIREIGEFLTINEIASSGEELELLFTTDENLPKEINGVRITKIGDIIDRIQSTFRFLSIQWKKLPNSNLRI